MAPESVSRYQAAPSRYQPVRTPFSVDAYQAPSGARYQPTGTKPSALKA